MTYLFGDRHPPGWMVWGEGEPPPGSVGWGCLEQKPARRTPVVASLPSAPTPLGNPRLGRAKPNREEPFACLPISRSVNRWFGGVGPLLGENLRSSFFLSLGDASRSSQPKWRSFLNKNCGVFATLSRAEKLHNFQLSAAHIFFYENSIRRGGGLRSQEPPSRGGGLKNCAT